jgi:uncharacterized protein (TIGR00369 family)
MDAPEGFQPHFRKSPLTEPWEPLFSKEGLEGIHIGLRIAQAHTNSRGFAHGGLISALADNAMGLSCGMLAGGASSYVTVNLAIDFLGAAQIGQWLEVEPAFVKLGKTLSFAQCFVTADGEPCARANATFRAVSRT